MSWPVQQSEPIGRFWRMASKSVAKPVGSTADGEMIADGSFMPCGCAPGLRRYVVFQRGYYRLLSNGFLSPMLAWLEECWSCGAQWCNEDYTGGPL